MSRARCAIEVHGVAQGVGFRPFVHALAVRFGLGGLVYNAAGAVYIEIEGDEPAIAEFVDQLRLAPPLAALRRIMCRADAPRGERCFRILPSDVEGTGQVVVPADVATCAECLRELFDDESRRCGHPFINCTQCGPRATIVTGMPYDRERTTMAAFAKCTKCEQEYASPNDRRFHAQPIACPDCGPRLYLLDASGCAVATADPLAALAAAIIQGRIVALKGVGGFHLICDATSDAAVAELRRRKHRSTKPFAIMVADLASAARVCLLEGAARELLSSAARPIVVLGAREDSGLSRLISPGMASLGVMLPYAPVHHLLLRALAGRELVITSGNLSDEPIACTDEEALAQLGGVADLFLTHDRPIRLRCEDSVVRVSGDRALPLRRSRGYAPLPVELGFELGIPALALGGHGKAVFALGQGKHAVLSPHFGDLESYPAYAAFGQTIAHFECVFRIRPQRLAHDLHADFASTRYALARQQREPHVELVAVQHHHAHMASCMVDNGLTGQVIGVCFDGVGLGSDGTLWGGEFLVGEYAGYVRAAHLSQVPLPGGDHAAREPWRVALAHLRAAGLGPSEAALDGRVERQAISALEAIMEADLGCPRTSSMGRLFDAVAALSGVLCTASHEGEAGQRLEALAESVAPAGTYPVAILEGAPLIVDTTQLVRELARDVRRGVSQALIARRFHTAIVDLVARTCERLRALFRVERVVLSGGVFANAILAREVPARLSAQGFSAFSHRQVPPNDGGLCLGQLAVAAHATPPQAALPGVQGVH